MRIDAYGLIPGSAPMRAKTKSSGLSFSIDESNDANSPSDVAGTVAQQSVSLGALLSLQSSEMDTIERRATAKGHSLLKDLSHLQAALLGEGDIAERLVELKGRLPDLQLTGDDLLDPILREIDLRVRVELAKRGL